MSSPFVWKGSPALPGVGKAQTSLWSVSRNPAGLPPEPSLTSTERCLAYLFDTDAVSEVLRKRPLPAYLEWLATIPPAEQFTSAVVVGELYRGAFRSVHRDRHLANIEGRILSALTVLPYDHSMACVYGEIHAALTTSGRILEDADLQIAATAIHHGLELVTANVQHFERIQTLRLQHVLADAKRAAVKEQAQRSAT